jgi:hypothetical protein
VITELSTATVTPTPLPCLAIDPQLLQTPSDVSAQEGGTGSESMDPGFAPAAICLRVSQKNPTYGEIEGAMHGNLVWGNVHSMSLSHILSNLFVGAEIPRVSPLQVVEMQTALASKRFACEMANIISRVCFKSSLFWPSHTYRMFQCERLSHETGCWLFIGAQHAHASSPFVHFASSWICCDAAKEITEIASRFNGLCSALLAAHQQEALALARRLAVVEQEQQVAELTLQEQRSKILEQGALIAQYETLLGHGQEKLPQYYERMSITHNCFHYSKSVRVLPHFNIVLNHDNHGILSMFSTSYKSDSTNIFLVFWY